MFLKGTSAALVSVVTFAPRPVDAQSTPPNLIQNPQVVQVLWNGPAGRTARDNSDFLSKFIRTNNWMKASWNVNNGVVIRNTGLRSGGWSIVPVDVATNLRSPTIAGCNATQVWHQSTSTELCDADVVAELEYQLQVGHLPYDLSRCDSASPRNCNMDAIYVVQLPIGVLERSFNSATNAPGARLCEPVDSLAVVCGYHDKFITTIAGTKIVVAYTVLPDFDDPNCQHHALPPTLACTNNQPCNAAPFRDAILRCDRTGSVTGTCDGDLRQCVATTTQGIPARNMTVLLSHEVGETMTDPELLDQSREIADLCQDSTQFPFGLLGGTNYTIQQLGRPGAPGGCYLQCSDTPGQCAMQGDPALMMSVLDPLLH